MKNHKRPGFLTINQMAEKCGINYPRFYDMVRRAQSLPAPAHNPPNTSRKFYLESELDTIKALVAKFN